VQAILMSRGPRLNRWHLAEWLVVSFVLFEVFTTYVHGFFSLKNFAPIGLAVFGATAYLTVMMSVNTRARLIFASRVMLVGLVVNAAWGMLGFVSAILFGTTFAVSKGLKELVKPAFGFAYESNIFGSTCAAGTLIFLTLWREGNAVCSKRVAALGALVCFGGMIASLTRGAWIGFAVVFVIWLIAPRRGTRRSGGVERLALLIMVMPVVLLAGAFLMSQASTATSGDAFGAIAAKAEESFNFSSDTGRGRLIEWQTAIADIRTSPIFGLGVNAYSFFHPSTGVDQRPAYIGNLWVRVLYESGLVGLVLFAGFIFAVLWPTRALFWSRGDLSSVARAFTFGWASLGIAYIGTDSMLLMWPWLLLGLTRAAHLLAERQYRALRLEALTAANGHANGSTNGSVNGLAGVAESNGHGPVPGRLPTGA
jgi:O-antigen ligase